MTFKTISKNGQHALLFMNKKRSVCGLTPAMRRKYHQLLLVAQERQKQKREWSAPQPHRFGLSFGPPLWRKGDWFWYVLIMILILL